MTIKQLKEVSKILEKIGVLDLVLSGDISDIDIHKVYRNLIINNMLVDLVRVMNNESDNVDIEDMEIADVINIIKNFFSNLQEQINSLIENTEKNEQEITKK